MHYVIIIVCIVIIILFQSGVYTNTLKKLRKFGTIFPKAAYTELQLVRDESGVVCIVDKEAVHKLQAKRQHDIDIHEKAIEESKRKIKDLQVMYNSSLGVDNMQANVMAAGIRSEKVKLQELNDRLGALRSSSVKTPVFSSDNEVRNTIVTSINKYLERNISSTSDFHLIKDIVDRNSDAAEDEIQNQIPVPLYCGLMGTMIGIIVGILYLWLSGDLDALLGSSQTLSGGAGGIKALLGGVALAMFSSIFGIAFTTHGSWKMKQEKAVEESGKHNFLSWMQAELLPAMNTDAASAMRVMVENLSAFNSAFATNTDELNESLSQVAEATKGQAEILEAINELKITRIATANIEVYDKLKNCTNEIGQLALFLKESQTYLSQVRALNKKLDDADARSRMIEEMAAYFQQERANIDNISGIIARSMGQADSALQQSIDVLKENITQKNDEIVKHMVEQNQRLVRVLDEQQSMLESKAKELDQLLTELTHLTDIKKSMQDLVKATTEQNRKIDDLTQKIHELAQMKAAGGVAATQFEIPIGYRVLAIVTFTIASLSCLFFVVMRVLCLIGYDW